MQLKGDTETIKLSVSCSPIILQQREKQVKRKPKKLAIDQRGCIVQLKKTDFEQKQWKKCVALKSLGEKRCGIKGGAKEMTVVVGNDKSFIIWCQILVKCEGNTNSPEFALLKLLLINNLPLKPLLGYHLWFPLFNLTFWGYTLFSPKDCK